MIKESGYAAAICTDILDNKPSIKILERFGWSKDRKFNNKKTYNDVGIFSIDLTKPFRRRTPKKVVKKATRIMRRSK
jgi:hypothetical protein